MTAARDRLARAHRFEGQLVAILGTTVPGSARGHVVYMRLHWHREYLLECQASVADLEIFGQGLNMAAPAL
jgi:hypothetical protein